MAHLQRSVASLRVGGDALRPERITKLLGHEPTRGQIKGEEIIGPVTGNKRIIKTGMWVLEAADCEPENLDAQISDLLGKLTADLSIWAQIKSEFKLDLFCGLFMGVNNEGLSISAASLEALGQRGIELALDIYGPLSKELEQDA